MFESSDVFTIVGPEAYFHGVLTVRGSVRVEGEVEGNITEAQNVIVGARGKVRGDVCAETIVIAGEVTGDVVATAQLELKSGGKITGNIRAPKLSIEEGAIFEGHCTMADSGEKPHTGRRKKQDEASKDESSRETQTLSS